MCEDCRKLDALYAAMLELAAYQGYYSACCPEPSEK